MNQSEVTLEGAFEQLYAAIDELNQARDSQIQLVKLPDTVLFGASAALDSLGLVTLVLGYEGRLFDTYGAEISLASEEAMSRRRSPFRTVGTLAEYAYGLISGNECADDGE